MPPFGTGRRSLRALLAFVLAASGAPSGRADDLPTTSTLEANLTQIGEVVIRGKPVFDPDDPRENRLLYRLANRLHVPTRESAIRAQLLFQPGDPFEQQEIAETERNLRTLRFLREPRVRPVRYHDGVVDIEVESHDVWTMSPGFSFGRSGGTNRTNLEFEDSNFLGFGKFVQAGIGSDVDRTSTTLEWRDPNVFGSRWRSGVRFAHSTDGGGRACTRRGSRSSARWRHRTARLRFGSTRSALANGIHVDLAVPLDRDASARGLQFLIETKRSF